MGQGPLVILSGPSGSGKSTVVERLLATSRLPVRRAVTVTTRPMREGERDGVDYHFWTREQFQEQRAAGAFLECAEVHGNYYGTPRYEVEEYRAGGDGVILVIDVQGAEQVRRLCPDAVSVFLIAGSPELYEQRIRKRGTESEEAIATRLATARRELERQGEYEHVIVSDDLPRAVAELEGLIKQNFTNGGQQCSTS
jgi:guanylate kinase